MENPSENESPSEHQSSRKSIWKDLIAAIKGTEADYTKIKLNKAIFLLAVPMILELVMESVFAVVDIYFVGKLGSEAVATVGLTETYMFLVYSIAMGLSMAVTAIISRRIGEKKQEDAGKTAFQAILLALTASLPFTVLGIFFAPEMLKLMGASDWALEHGYQYTQWMMGSNAIIILIFVINAIFRGAGDAAIAMRVLIIANTINIFLDPILIMGWGPFPQLGIEGAAIATNIGRGIGILIQLWYLIKGGKHIQILRSELKWNGKHIWSILKTSLGGIGQMLVAMTSWIFLIRILADIGSDAVAASTIVIRLIMFTLMPAWGLSNAAATLVGQNLGAGSPDRAESSIWKIGIYNMIFLILVSFCYFFLSEELMRIFSNNKNVIQIGAEWLKILSYSYFIYGWWMITAQAFNGAGDTKTPTWINMVFLWLIQIPLSYLLALQYEWGPTGVFWTVFIAETSGGVFTLWLFRRGKWKLAKV